MNLTTTSATMMTTFRSTLLPFRRALMKSRSIRAGVDRREPLFSKRGPSLSNNQQPFLLTPINGACAPMLPIRGWAPLAPISVCPAVPATRLSLRALLRIIPFEDTIFPSWCFPVSTNKSERERQRESEREELLFSSLSSFRHRDKPSSVVDVSNDVAPSGWPAYVDKKRTTQ